MRSALALAFLALARPAAALSGLALRVDAYAGPENLTARDTPATVVSPSRITQGPSVLGATALFQVGRVAVGGGVEEGIGASTDAASFFGLGGLAFEPVSFVRLELLGELGRRDAAGRETYLGLRPGVSFGIPLLPFRIGVSGLARWGLATGRLGAADYGVLGRVGFEL